MNRGTTDCRMGRFMTGSARVTVHKQRLEVMSRCVCYFLVEVAVAKLLKERRSVVFIKVNFVD
jgi:hypothetical protein